VIENGVISFAARESGSKRGRTAAKVVTTSLFLTGPKQGRKSHGTGRLTEGFAVSAGLTSKIVEVETGLPFAIALIVILY
jgi:hypothetical protein